MSGWMDKPDGYRHLYQGRDADMYLRYLPYQHRYTDTHLGRYLVRTRITTYLGYIGHGSVLAVWGTAIAVISFTEFQPLEPYAHLVVQVRSSPASVRSLELVK